MRKYKSYLIILLLFLYTLLSFFFFRNISYKIISDFTFTIFMIFISYMFFGYRNNKLNPVKRRVVITTLIISFFFILIIYLSGFKNGFVHNNNLLTNNFYLNGLLVLTSVFNIEFIRYLFISANKDRIVRNILFTFILCIFEFILLNKFSSNLDFIDLLLIFSFNFVPLLIFSIVFTYTNFYLGYYVPITYKVFIYTYLFFIPLISNVSRYIIVFLSIFILFIIYKIISRNMNLYYYGNEHNFNNNIISIKDLPVIFITILFIYLVSGIGSFYLVGIASKSMEPSIKVGDCAFISRINNSSKLKINDIILFKDDDNNSIVHRVVSITNKNGHIIYHTKGDSNISGDNLDLELKDIEGRVLFIIPSVAIPSIKLDQMIG